MDEFELVFPCEFAIKVIGQDVDDFERYVRTVIIQHVPDLLPEAFSTRTSSNNNYLSISVSFCAESRAQLDSLYRTLGSDSRVKLIL
jgi:putative lipoic acid-binding regulatory protein